MSESIGLQGGRSRQWKIAVVFLPLFILTSFEAEGQEEAVSLIDDQYIVDGEFKAPELLIARRRRKKKRRKKRRRRSPSSYSRRSAKKAINLQVFANPIAQTFLDGNTELAGALSLQGFFGKKASAGIYVGYDREVQEDDTISDGEDVFADHNQLMLGVTGNGYLTGNNRRGGVVITPLALLILPSGQKRTFDGAQVSPSTETSLGITGAVYGGYHYIHRSGFNVQAMAGVSLAVVPERVDYELVEGSGISSITSQEGIAPGIQISLGYAF